MVGKASADHDPPSSAGIFAGFGKPHDSKAGPTRMPALPGLLQGLEAGGLIARGGRSEVQGGGAKQRSAAIMPLRCAEFEGPSKGWTRWIDER